MLLIALVLLLVLGAAVAHASGASAPEAAATAACTYCHGEGCDECDGLGYVTSDSVFAFSFWALVPPLVAIALALITREVYSSLFLGILLGAFLYANGNPVTALDTMINDSLIASVADNAGIFIFLVLLGILVALLNRSGGSAAFGRWTETHIKTRVGAQIATVILGVLIFVDDYFNCLTVGSVMRPVSDRHKISRAKLAYIIDATAAPVCMIAPISSWAAAVTGVVEGDDGIALFVQAIPWNYYSILTLVFILVLAIARVDYGPMRLHEMNAALKGDLYTSGEHVDKAMENTEYSERGRVIDLVLPIVLLIVACFFAMIYVGGFWDAESGCAGDLIASFGNTDAFVALPWGSVIALLITLIYYLCRRVITFKDAMKCVPQGFTNMVPAITILTLAGGLKNIVNGSLGAKFFIGNAMLGASEALFMVLPAVIFLVGCFLSFSTGTSWGTFGILIPIISVVFPADSVLFHVGIGACLAGAVFGDHCSPISDTSIMASAGAMCDHVNHISTQLPYALTVGGVCFVNYLLAGFIQNPWICLAIGLVLTVATIFAVRAIMDRRSASAQE
ncbi:MAG: Na+/H+ antiporter NhaC family protein [Lachnospiraceae bacterium]|nr:Na+/H+ antiporter NhaC family protein [Lachnospiraceae bacterium]